MMMVGLFPLPDQPSAFALIADGGPDSAWLVQPKPSRSAGPRQDRNGEASVEPLAVRASKM
jgi:hypothetical protein